MENAMPVNPVSVETTTPTPVTKSSGIDYGKAITWVFSSPDAVNTILKVSLLLLSCILIIPALFVGPWVFGWTLATIKNIQQGKWQLAEIDLMEQFKSGLIFTVIIFVISLVIQMVSFIPQLAIAGLGSDSDMALIAGSISVIFSFVIMVVSFIFSIIQYFAMVIYAKTGDLNSLFNIENYKSIWAKNGIHTIVGPLAIGIVSIPVMIIGLMALCIGMFPAAVVIYAMQAGILGQFDVSEVK